jgi:hypothetical protein
MFTPFYSILRYNDLDILLAPQKIKASFVVPNEPLLAMLNVPIYPPWFIFGRALPVVQHLLDSFSAYVLHAIFMAGLPVLHHLMVSSFLKWRQHFFF